MTQLATQTWPHQLTDHRLRCVPLYRNSKASYVKGEQWQTGAALDDSAPILAGECDLGWRLEKSSLVIVDMDVVTAWLGNPARLQVAEDGRENFRRWLTAQRLFFPDTFAVTSPGRQDKSHLPGVHLYYWQNPAWHVLYNLHPTRACEILSTGILRFTCESQVRNTADIAVLPEATARALCTKDHIKENEGLGYLSKIAGLNGYYAHIKGVWVKAGLGSEDEFDRAIMEFNRAIDSPMDEQRLQTTVARHKEWKR